MENPHHRPLAQERRAARFWVLFLSGLIGINLLMAIIAIVIAAGDPSFRPMPSYGENAVDWETRRQWQRASDTLGWTARVQRSVSPSGIEIELVDAQGHGVVGASGTVQAYHFTRADQCATVPVTASSDRPGVYLAAMDTARDGRWHVLIDLKRSAQERFLWDHDVEWRR